MRASLEIHAGTLRIAGRHYSNCLIWALRQEARNGGYIKSRRSVRGWWRHWLWSADGVKWVSFSPVKPRDGKLIPPPIFWGAVVDDALELLN